MLTTARVVNALRPEAAGGLLLAMVVQSAVFSATPFLIADVGDRFGVGAGTAALISTAQVGGFAAANWALSRWGRASGRLVTAAAVVVAGANLASAAAPTFLALAALRLVTGAAMAAGAWVAWSDGVRHPRRLAEVAVVGPMTGVVAAPLLAMLADRGDDRLVFLVLGVVSAMAALVPVRVAPAPPRPTRGTGARADRRVLLALATLTCAGSSVFILASVIAREQAGLSTAVVSLGFSLNAAAAIPSARWTGRRPVAGVWFASSGVAALVVGLTPGAGLYLAAMAWWGFAFLLAQPAVYGWLTRQLDDTAGPIGEAQAAMFAGRVVGPVLGGLLVEHGAATVLAVGASVGMVAAGLGLELLEQRSGGRALVRPSRTPRPALTTPG